MKKFFAMMFACMLILSTTTTTVSATEVPSPTAAAAATEAPTPTVAADPYSGIGCYMAFFQIQTTSWVYRNNFEDPNTGYGSDTFKTVYNNETSAATTTEINDTVIDGDGEYTISLKNISLEGSTDFYMVAISTNIPLDAGIQVTAASLKYGSREITSKFWQKVDNKEHVHIMLIDQWNNATKDTVNTLVPPDGSDMTITFTVSGFGYEKTIAEPTAAPSEVTTAPTAAAAEASADTTAQENVTAADQDEESNSALSTGAIAGIIAGAVIVVIILIVVITSKRKKK